MKFVLGALFLVYAAVYYYAVGWDHAGMMLYYGMPVYGMPSLLYHVKETYQMVTLTL